MMALSLAIKGDPNEIRACADWLDPKLHGALEDVEVELTYMLSDAQYLWTGESGSAFSTATQKLRRANLEVPTYVKDLASVLRAYAGRLERGAADFDDYAAYAEAHGLEVWGKKIPIPRSWVADEPHGALVGSPEAVEWEAYLTRIEVYNDLSTKVGTFWGELEVWVAEHFGTLVARIDDFQDASKAYAGLVDGNDVTVNAALTSTEAIMAQNVERWRAIASEKYSKAHTFTRQLRSGNPALRAAAEAADPRGLRQSASALAEVIQGVSRTSKIIPIAGGVIDVVVTGQEIADGGSESSAIASLAGVTAGGVIGGALVPTIVAAVAAVPVAAVAIPVVVIGSFAVAGGYAAKYAWEAAVSLDVRESIDAGISDFFDLSSPTSWRVNL